MRELLSIGLENHRHGRIEQAAAAYERVIEADPGNPDANHLLGIVAHQMGRDDLSVELITTAIGTNPGIADYHCNLGNALRGLTRNDEAADAYRIALKLTPDDPEIHSNLGNALRDLGRHDESMTAYGQALALNPEFAEAHNNLGTVQQELGKLNDATASFDEAIRLDDGNTQAYNNLGISLLDMNDLVQAEAALRNALAIEPDYAEAHFNLSRVLLMAEDFEDGWKQNEWRWLCNDFPSTWREFPQAMWQGEDLADKTILVWSEQGVGDEIMFANTLPELVQNAEKVIIECNDRLVPVFERSFDSVTAVARQEPPDSKIENAAADFQIPIGSICKFYRKSVEEFPSDRAGYLTADSDLTAEIKARYAALGDGMKVGISWRSGNPIVGHQRSIPLEFWDEILSSDGCQFVNLQYGDVDEDLAGVLERTGVQVFKDDAVDPLTSAEEWFAQIQALDHVISVDNSTIQVSGSLGIPTWTLLSEVPEWRFGLKRLDHLWHPSVRVFRQHKKGEWELLMKEVAFTFAALLENEGYVAP